MKVGVRAGVNKQKERGAIAVFFDEETREAILKGEYDGADYVKGLDFDAISCASGEIFFAALKNSPNVIVCGLGERKKITAESLRNAGAGAVLFASSKKISALMVSSPNIEKMDLEDSFRYIAEGMLLANYSFDRYKSDREKFRIIEKIEFLTKFPSASILKEVEITALNTHLCRDLVNDTADEVNPASFAKLAGSTAKKAGIKCTVLNKKMIEKKKMGLILAVNRGSAVPAQVVVLEYRGDKKSKKLFGLVGKGITFDSGGMNIKTSGSMGTMRMDMAGAAAVLYTMKTLAELKVKKNVSAVIPLTENMVSSTSYRPGDIFTSYSGKTVEIGNTDAEGRLILADALSYMEKEIKPDAVIDVATLTGACVVTFGETVAAYLATDESIAGIIEEASKETGEKLWRLPFFDDYDDRMKSDSADLNNMSAEKNAGTISGAVFLRNFVEKTKWAHIDIAGTAWYSKQRGYRPKNATGYGVRLLVDVIKKWS